MTPTLALTVTAVITPPLDETSAPAVGAEIAAYMDAALGMTSHGDDGWASWTFLTDHDDQPFGNRMAALQRVLQASVPARTTVRIVGLEGITGDEGERRLRAHQGRPAPLGLTEVPPIPEVVTTAQFAELLGVTPTRTRQLRTERQAADNADREHPFPAEFIPGHWLRTDAEAYAALERPAGRPAKASPTTSYGTWVNHGDGGTSVEAQVEAALGEHATEYDVSGLANLYREAINDSLADTGITLAGDEFYGPHPKGDDAASLIRLGIGAVDFWAIVEGYDTTP